MKKSVKGKTNNLNMNSILKLDLGKLDVLLFVSSCTRSNIEWYFSLQDSHSVMKEDTMSQESDVLISLDAMKCRSLPQRLPSVRVALNFDKANSKETAAENITEGPPKGAALVI